MAKLSRYILRKLQPGQVVSEEGVEYKRLENDGAWRVNVMVGGRRYHRMVGLESAGFTKTQALDVIAKLRAAKHEKRHGVRSPRTEAVSFETLAAAYLKYLEETGGNDLKAKRERLSLHLLPHMGKLRASALTGADFKRYCATRIKEEAAPATINRELAVASHMLRVASDPEAMNVLPAMPCRIARLKEPDSKLVYMTPDQVRALIYAAAQDASPHALPYVMVSVHTGMRASPVMAIRLQDIDLSRRVIWVEKDKAGEREQPITPDLAEYLAQVLAVTPADRVWLFPSRGASGHLESPNKMWNRIVKAAGLPRSITPHVARHTMATTAAHAGVDAPTLQAMGGWKTRAMVERYTHSGSLAAGMERLGRAFK